ncbi:MAG: aminopeptidase P family protein [Desulfobacteraceae bacterium]|nr:MAG: aminopeptidase P family protein [Desulfobacteraceae bacterium]
MKKETLKNRIRTLRVKLKRLQQDTIWILQPENRRYLSGFKAQDLLFTESSGSLLITEKSALLLTDSRYTLEAEKEAVDFEVVTLKKGLIESLPAILSDLGTRHLGFEEGYVTVEAHKSLVKGLRKMRTRPKLTPLNGLVEEMREVKEPEEIRLLKASGDLMSRILADVIPGIKPGRVEKEIAWEIEERARQGGAEGLAFPSIVASGPNSALPHATPTTRKIREGEPITLDVGVRVEGYCCDMTRTIFLGKPRPEFAKIYRIVREAQVAAMEKVLPGAESTAVDATARDMIRDEGYGEYFGHSLGHGVGLEPHERPRLGPRNPVELKEGMVVTVEPGIYLPGKGGVRLEHMVAITRQGPRILTRDNHFYDF